MKELEKTYTPGEIESRIYQKWLDKNTSTQTRRKGSGKGKSPSPS